MLLNAFKSKVFFVIVILFFVSIVAALSSIVGWASSYLLYGFGFALVFLIGLNITCLLHEYGHIQKARKLGFTISFRVVRIGFVQLNYERSEEMSATERYLISCAPYKQIRDIFVTLLILVLLLVIGWFAPPILRIVFLCFSFFYVLFLIAEICGYLVVKDKKTGGFALKFASTVTSGELQEIAEYHKKEKEPQDKEEAIDDDT